MNIPDVLDQARNWIPERLGIRCLEDWVEDGVEPGETKLDVPSYCQVDNYSCGAVAVYGVVRYFKPRANYDREQKLVKPRRGIGAGKTQVIRGLRACGITVSYRTGLGFDDLCDFIEAGRPLIVGVGRNEGTPDGDHWVAAYGVRRRPRRVFITNQGRLFYSREQLTWREFKTTWGPIGEAIVCWRR